MIARSGSKASLSAVEQARVFSDLLDERQAQTTVSDRSRLRLLYDDVSMSVVSFVFVGRAAKHAAT